MDFKQSELLLIMGLKTT